MNQPDRVLDHFALRGWPFALTPDLDRYFPWPEYQAILAALDYALSRGDGLLKVVGPVGSGKTLLTHLLLTRLGESGRATAYLNAPVATADRLPAMVLREFRAPLADGQDAYAALQDHLLAIHRAGQRAVLVVDEAQALGSAGLEMIRLMSNLETATQKLLQIVLFGQEELDRLLRHQALRQVAQRVTFAFQTRPLSRRLVADYVRHRIDRSSTAQQRRELFSAGALRRLAAHSGGLPRLINILADKALLAAYAEGRTLVATRDVDRAAADSPDLLPRRSLWQWLAGGHRAA